MDFHVFEGSSELTTLIAITMIVYVVIMFLVSYAASKRINNVEDYVVAGRRLPITLAVPALFATWFCGATLLTATDEVRDRGLTAATLDPLGAGFCLILAGLFFAVPLWRMKLTTLPDFYKRRFGTRAELLAAAVMIPTFLGWIAAQFVALAGVLHLFFGIDMVLGILLVCCVGLGYTLLGGMWAVTLTDAVQVIMLIVGLIALWFVATDVLGDGSVVAGMDILMTQTPAERLMIIPTESLVALVGWLGVFSAGALGNLAGQDLMQRVFSAGSANIAKWACIIAGVLYLTIGFLPLSLGLAADLLLPEGANQATLPLLAKIFLHPVMAVIFVVTIFSAVLSTIDSAILAPSTVLAQNLLSKVKSINIDPLKLNRLAVIVVSITSLIFAYLGESAYDLLETSYELGMVSLLAPLTLGIFLKNRSELAALASMLSGTGIWTIHMLFEQEFIFGYELLPVGLASTIISFLAYLAVIKFDPDSTPPDYGHTNG